MAVEVAQKNDKKRKPDSTEEEDVGVYKLELPLDEEDENGELSDDGQVDEFPEIDTRSDSSSNASGEDGGDGDDDGDDEDTEEDESEEDSDLHIFPKPKTIISDITGQPKRVYPHIEPDYDSDSSTEDVGCVSF